MDMTFKLQVFEGPLDLLLYLIEKNKVNIYDIPIVEITAQYMEYVDPVNLEELVGDIRLSDLNRIFQSIMKRQEEKIDKVRSKFGKIEKEEVSLEEKMDFLTDYATSHKHFSFRGMLTASSSKVEVIVTFLAILELMKTGKLTIVQEHIFDDIRIESRIAA